MVDGILLLDKPIGITSHDLVDKVRKIFDQRKVGHTGILDPLATGLMLMLLGKGTMLSSLLTNADKKYSAVFQFGTSTDSFDGEGKIIEEKDPGQMDVEQFESLCRNYTGKINQLIPAYSAKKVAGIKMYKSARKGEKVPERFKDVEIYSIKTTAFNWPEVELDIHCSSGTYVRSIVHEIGQKIGCGGYLKALVRTAIDDFTLSQAVAFEHLSDAVNNGDYSQVKSLADALPGRPTISIRPEYYRLILEGRPFIKRYLQQTDYKGPGGCLSLLTGPENKILAMVKLNYNWGSINRLENRDVLGEYVRIIDEGHIRQKRS
ncbi:MAG: tRNA pseudouridine(55) synthase TruB [candidate division Zixibacteria bacterium]|nr:tRNA pseudouridine(55) synthase TruB [candidate division Zixibacteria bacterium]